MKHFGDYVCAELNGRCIDVNARGVSKASGIAKLIGRIGVDENNVYTIGDNFNDLCMLTAYNGYAVAHAPEEVRRQAGNTVRSVAELIDQLMAEEPNVQHFGKLVRDKIPELISSEGFTPGTRRLSDAEYIAELNRKLREETDEYLAGENPEEIADILEVIEAICQAKNYSLSMIQEIKENKRKERGGFENRIYLIDKR